MARRRTSSLLLLLLQLLLLLPSTISFEAASLLHHRSSGSRHGTSTLFATATVDAAGESSPETTRRGAIQHAANLATTSLVVNRIAGTLPAQSAEAAPEVTHKVRFKIKLAAVEASRSDRDDIALQVERGEIVVGLFGKAAPGVVENVLSYCVQGTTIEEGSLIRAASYEGASFWRSEPGEQVEVGKAVGLKKVEGVARIDYRGRLFPDAHITAADFNRIPHDQRGLLTRGLNQTGPDFSVTFGPAPQLDETSVVFGRVLSGDELLSKIESIPVYTYHAAPESGSLADTVFKAQREAYVDLAKALGDTRVKDQRGNLLRKVEIEEVTRL